MDRFWVIQVVEICTEVVTPWVPSSLLRCSELETLVLELSRVVSERDFLAAQIKADALAMNERIQQATKQGSVCHQHVFDWLINWLIDRSMMDRSNRSIDRLNRIDRLTVHCALLSTCFQSVSGVFLDPINRYKQKLNKFDFLLTPLCCVTDGHGIWPLIVLIALKWEMFS